MFTKYNFYLETNLVNKRYFTVSANRIKAFIFFNLSLNLLQCVGVFDKVCCPDRFQRFSIRTIQDSKNLVCHTL